MPYSVKGVDSRVHQKHHSANENSKNRHYSSLGQRKDHAYENVDLRRAHAYHSSKVVLLSLFLSELFYFFISHCISVISFLFVLFLLCQFHLFSLFPSFEGTSSFSWDSRLIQRFFVYLWLHVLFFYFFLLFF